MHKSTLPVLRSGWISRSPRPGSTNVRLHTGELVRANEMPELAFGTPVSVEIFDRRGGALVGRVFLAASHRRPRPDTPLALVDESNLAGLAEPSDPVAWRLGAVKCYAAGLALERIGYRPQLCADPCADRRAYAQHLPSARAISAAKWRWTRRIFACHDRETQHADFGLLTEASLHPSSIILTNDKFREPILRARFPWLNTADGQHRIHRVEVHGDRIEIPSLGLSELVPAALFN